MHQGHRIVVGLLAIMSLLVAGCTAEGKEVYRYDSTAGMAAGGANLQDVHDTFPSPGEVRISFSIGGTGSAQVTIQDADGDEVFTESISGSGGAARSEVMDGAAGTWTIDIDFTNWQGGFALSITEA